MNCALMANVSWVTVPVTCTLPQAALAAALKRLPPLTAVVQEAEVLSLVAVTTVVPPTQTVAGRADAEAATGVPLHGVTKRILSKPMSERPRSEVARKRRTVVAEVLVTVYSYSVHVAAWPRAGEVSAVKLLVLPVASVTVATLPAESNVDDVVPAGSVADRSRPRLS